VGGLERRIKNLEPALVGDECPECGWSDDGSEGDEEAPYEILFVGEGGNLGTSAFCETCGERIPEIVFADDLPPAWGAPGGAPRERREEQSGGE
jgi:hypothetical protein